MQINEAVNYVNQEFKERRGIELSYSTRIAVEGLITRGRKIALREATEEDFDAAVKVLSERLSVGLETQTALQNTMSGFQVETQVTGGLSDVKRAICPMWPFCK